jgi:acyl dehydratase
MTETTDTTASPAIHLGLEYPMTPGVVDRDGVIAYARAVDDPNPPHVEGAVAPPLYTVALIFQTWGVANLAMLDEGAIVNRRAGVHAEHDVVFHAPLVPGTPVQWTSTGYCVKPTPAGPFNTVHTVIADADGAPLVEHWWSSLHIGGSIAPHLDAAGYGPDLADHAFPEAARANPVGTYTFAVAADQSFRYAGASGDRSPMHVNDEAAQRAGFPSKFLQGLCTFAMTSGAVVKLGADGDVARLRRLATRFSSPVFPHHELTVALYEAGTNDAGNRVLAFEAASNGQTVLKHGLAEIAP